MVDFAKLAAPFPPAAVSWRIGSTTSDKTRGMALAYIDARDVMDRLDEVCGPDGWECRYPHAGQKTVCEIGILYNDRWVYKADGAGDSDVEAEKGALSDAFKRAAVRWGIGRYLYHLPSPWVEITTKGRSAVIKPEELGRLAGILANYSGANRQASPPPSLPPSRPVADAHLVVGDGRSTHQIKKDEKHEKTIATLVESAKLALSLCINRTMVIEWWRENSDALIEGLPDAEFETIKAMVKKRRDQLPELEKVA